MFIRRRGRRLPALWVEPEPEPEDPEGKTILMEIRNGKFRAVFYDITFESFPHPTKITGGFYDVPWIEASPEKQEEIYAKYRSAFLNKTAMSIRKLMRANLKGGPNESTRSSRNSSRRA